MPNRTAKAHHISKDGSCGVGGNITCIGSTFGDCCGKTGRFVKSNRFVVHVLTSVVNRQLRFDRVSLTRTYPHIKSTLTSFAHQILFILLTAHSVPLVTVKTGDALVWVTRRMASVGRTLAICCVDPRLESAVPMPACKFLSEGMALLELTLKISQGAEIAPMNVVLESVNSGSASQQQPARPRPLLPLQRPGHLPQQQLLPVPTGHVVGLRSSRAQEPQSSTATAAMRGDSVATRTGSATQDLVGMSYKIVIAISCS